MAAVMAGGMVPPLAIALCTTFFKKKFTEKERQSGIVNYVMGLSFITEGAIPFAAQDPLRVIPSCLAGAAVAGGLSMAFGCTLRAPHGGLFVLPTIGNPVMYLAAVVIHPFRLQRQCGNRTSAGQQCPDRTGKYHRIQW